MLRAALTRAYKRQVLRSVPFIPEPRHYEPRDRWLTVEEVRSLLDACTAKHLKLYIILALHTAARPAALFDLRWSQVHFEERIIDLNPVGRRQTTKRRPSVRMSETLFEVLTEARKVTKSEFVISWGKKAIRDIGQSFKFACDEAGIEDATPYTLRHTAATWMAQRGVPMWEIAGLMGHTSTRMVERVYAKHHPDYMQKATRALDEALGLPDLRALSVPAAPKGGDEVPAKSLREMVGAPGIEPGTPTMST